MIAASASALIPHPTELRVCLLPTQTGWTLPGVELAEADSWQVVSSINQQIHAQFGINVMVLRYLNCPEPKTGRLKRVYVLENHSPSWVVPAEGRWVDHAELNRLVLAAPEHRAILETWFTEAEGGNISALRRPWATPGWLKVAIAWIHAQLNSLDLTATGPVRQIRTWERSCVLQVSTRSGDIYFKAVPALFAHEPPLMQALSKHYPAHIPRILAIDTDQHWMLMPDFAGQSLSQVLDLSRWQSALRCFAEIQIDLAEHISRWVELGCPERRLARMAAQIESLFHDLATIPLGPGFSEAEMDQLSALAPQLQTMCGDLASYDVPYTLEHGDFHARNIILTDRSTLYFDWSDSAIAHPFFSLSLFLRSIERENWFPGFSQVRPSLCNAYLEPWTVYEPMHRLIEAFELAQTLEVLHHAITYHQILLPSIEDKSAWSAIAPAHLKTLLEPSASA